jgi:threonine/homoserine/homoserine lactone efflux protein
MLGIQEFQLFLLACIMLNLTPGQDTLYILGRSAAQGKQAGMLSALGILTGILIHTLLAATGLSVILATSAPAFTVVKFAGAAYLIWLGIGFLTKAGGRSGQPEPPATLPAPWALFRQGVLTNALNPKVALFFVSFLPQFVSRQAQPVFAPLLLLGLIFLLTSSIWFLVLVNAASRLSAGLRDRAALGDLLKKLTGGLFIGLGIRLAFSQIR